MLLWHRRLAHINTKELCIVYKFFRWSRKCLPHGRCVSRIPFFQSAQNSFSSSFSPCIRLWRYGSLGHILTVGNFKFGTNFVPRPLQVCYYIPGLTCTICTCWSSSLSKCTRRRIWHCFGHTPRIWRRKFQSSTFRWDCENPLGWCQIVRGNAQLLDRRR